MIHFLDMIVYLYGRVCWSEEPEAVAKKYNLKIIEDNAQAIGACYFNNGARKRTGSLGDTEIFGCRKRDPAQHS